ncbi:molybdenum cofactor guanylyltransferase [Virgibacillus indicus]|uniref:Probable molybdenum cofactor guanylyltransferase n=1 Tax=Virgibacillus indicus TaxID=2024554 RepID=A0A265NDP5_9BACI|nr:molybdenum cofactor guanylyltransferase [Virgibacillus indicus]OZU90162.1 molybdenum cofactor guanylyltransferase [Virgibacillus indicus]
MRTCGVILSGGKSSRMGTTKSLLKLGERTVIEHIIEEVQSCTDEVCIVSNQPSLYRFLNKNIYTDRYKDKGPLAGFEAAMYHNDADVFVFAACDMPFINGEVYKYLLKQLNEYDAVVPVYNDQLHPLSGVYKRDVLPNIQEQLDKDLLKVKGFFEHIKVHYIKDFGDISEKILEMHFFNMNTPSHYEQAKFLMLV